MLSAEELVVPYDPRANVFGLPGRFDGEGFDTTQSLAFDIEDEIGEPVARLGMYRLGGVELVSPGGDETPPVFRGSWTPSDYLRLISEALAARPNQNRPATLYGFSYGAHIALVYAALDAALGIHAIGKIVAVMPTNFLWLGDSPYSMDRDLGWMLREHREHGQVDMDKPWEETRRVTLKDPNSRIVKLQVPRRVITDHTRPLDGFLDDSPMPAVFTGLTESNLLGHIEAETHMIAGAHDRVTVQDTARKIYGKLSPKAAGEFVLVQAWHDYGAREDEMAQVSQAAACLLAA